MLQLVFTERAQADLLEAWLYIAEENLAAADRVLDTVEQESKVLLMQPLMGRARPELGNQVRSWPSATPYILFYEVDDTELTVLRVLHHARDVKLVPFLLRSAVVLEMVRFILLGAGSRCQCAWLPACSGC